MSNPTVLVWDNGGHTADRYTIAIAARPGWHVYAMSRDAQSPAGVNMYCHSALMLEALPAWGRGVNMDDLPIEVNQAINERIKQG